MNDKIQYGPARRVAQFRHEVQAIGDLPTRAELERLIAYAHELGLGEVEVADELALIRGCLDGASMQARIAAGDIPVVEDVDALPAGDRCHFAAPVRFGRRRSDHIGHLLLTAGWVRFRGALDLSVAWGEVSAIRRDGREIVVAFYQSRRQLRFWCHSYSEVAIGVVIGNHLMRAAQSAAEPSNPEVHATIS